jgi:hypothetical protein
VLCVQVSMADEQTKDNSEEVQQCKAGGEYK